MVYPNIYSIHDLLESVERLVLPIQRYRISMAQDNSRVSEKSLHEDLVLIVQQNPEASNQTSDSLQGTLASKAVWIKVCPVAHTDIPQMP